MLAAFLRRIRHRTVGDLFRFGEAFVALGLVRALLLRMGFKRAVQLCGLQLLHESTPAPLPLPSGTQDAARAVAWAIAAAARRTPWESACLAQALAAALLLRRRRIPGTVVLGVRHAADDSPGVAAHAWVVVGDRTLVGAPEHQSYAPIAAYATLPLHA